MTENPLVTVIVVSYNHSKYIKENLDSIKNQIYDNIQLIVGDDASKDNSVEVFQQWLQENNYPAMTNFHRKNTGLATMLNECVTLAEGKYIKIIAADDFLHPESIAKCVHKLENLSEDFAMVFTDFYAIDDSGISVDFPLNYKNKHYFNQDGSLKSDQLVKYNCIIAPSVLIKKQAIVATGEYDSALLLEDHHRWLMINEKYKISFIDEKLAYYRVIPTSITGTRHDKMIEEDLYLRMKYDKSGINANQIFDYISSRYRKNKKIPDLIKNEYLKYPYRIKKLSFSLKYLHPYIYYLLLKIYRS
ncbi:glycosyltransferase family 2 protein [Chryseobacterium sp. GMJ5]|uniref:Glycosyltransferase family 2 protein n=1 Tax=Chryseobacterium gilvum TaxID=2976534 RepID=A0ABT2VX82_9FLAO|nr:glycosyltransferase family 2 protein [Chryseobacterium gilvum]MCU7614249.1 glycosyltransferase family 2 protein [Chryseobacterium gilvum]